MILLRVHYKPHSLLSNMTKTDWIFLFWSLAAVNCNQTTRSQPTPDLLRKWQKLRITQTKKSWGLHINWSHGRAAQECSGDYDRLSQGNKTPLRNYENGWFRFQDDIRHFNNLINLLSLQYNYFVEQGNESLETEITQFIVLRGLSDDAEEGPVDSCPGLVTLHSISSLSWVSRWQPMRGQHGKSSANQKPWCSHWESNCPDELWWGQCQGPLQRTERLLFN